MSLVTMRSHHVLTSLLSMVLVGTLGAGVSACRDKVAHASPVVDVPEVTDVIEVGHYTPRGREPLVLTEAEKGSGHNECNLPDHGNGVYSPVRSIPTGLQVMVPEHGGDTDLGYDVVFHMHGFAPIRKTVIQAARGVVLAGLDVGLGSQVYTERFTPPEVFDGILRDITRVLQEHAGDQRAHIRHLALSGWSAGYGGVNTILRHGDSQVDAVILLDGFHTDFKTGAPHDDNPDSVDGDRLSPIAGFAERATRGEKIFFMTHSAIGTEYVSTTRTSNWLLKRVGLSQTSADAGTDPYGMNGYVDTKGFHLRSFGGVDEKAHCDQTRHIAEAIRDILEPTWKTPAAQPASEPAPTGSVLGKAASPATTPSPNEHAAATPNATTTSAATPHTSTLTTPSRATMTSEMTSANDRSASNDSDRTDDQR